MRLIVGFMLGAYIWLHWSVKRSVDKHNKSGFNERHFHSYLDRD